MKTNSPRSDNRLFTLENAPGKVGWILLWLIGIPIPVLLIFFLLRGCT